MKIHVDFTLEVPLSDKTRLEILAGGGPFEEHQPDPRVFVQDDAEQYIVGYLTDNGIDVKVVQRNGMKVDGTFYGYEDR